jgi:hypothetical protein
VATSIGSCRPLLRVSPGPPLRLVPTPRSDHLLHAEVPYSTDGWITCLVPGCDCYGAWSADEESRALLEEYRAAHLRQVAALGSEPPERDCASDRTMLGGRRKILVAQY